MKIASGVVEKLRASEPRAKLTGSYKNESLSASDKYFDRLKLGRLF